MTPPVGAVAEPPRAEQGLSALNALASRYKEPSLRRSLRQVADTVIPYAAVWALSCWAAKSGHPWLSLLLTIPAGGLTLRLFIIQHDCGHGSFFKSQRAADMLGSAIGVLTLTPYAYWKQTHAIHHATSGNLDKRGWGDIDTRTVKEYRALSRWGRLGYRVYRSAPVLFLLGPVFHFVVYHRLPGIVPADWRRERLSILRTDLALAVLLLAASRTIGVGTFLQVQLPIVALASCAGVWFFYVQHQFEGTYWRRDGEWDLVSASFDGSSYYQMGPVLDWLTGDIGVHHIHHLNSRIPNYNLRRCMDENPAFQTARRLTLRESLACARLALWDEEQGRLVGFSAVRS